MKIIAVLGTGHMGTPIARRLLAGGNRVRVWNRSPERSEPLAAVGATVAASPSAAVDGADVVVVMLADAGAVETVLFGPDGAATALRPGTVVVQMSTIGPDEVRAVAGRLPAGVSLLDAPVGGSVNAARAGRWLSSRAALRTPWRGRFRCWNNSVRSVTAVRSAQAPPSSSSRTRAW
ncbi:NAD(P)-dependent oxidoreductase [Micromonospora chalcea]